MKQVAIQNPMDNYIDIIMLLSEQFHNNINNKNE